MELSVCIITKNEKEKLEKCLLKLVPYDFEIVVVDTGSTDGTVDMVHNYTHSTWQFTWIDDFAAAKNYAISKASHDMVLVVDSDEYLESCDISFLQQCIDDRPNEIGRIKRIEQYMDSDGECVETITWVNRLFNRQNYHYEGRIHEQVVSGNLFDYLNNGGLQDARESGAKYSVYDTRMLFLHDGYSGSKEDRQRKAHRNIRLLLEELQSSPEDAYLLYQTAKGYYMSGEYAESVRYFDQAIEQNLDTRLEYVIDMVTTYGYALLNSHQEQKALLLEGVYSYFEDSSDYVFLMGLIYMKNAMFDQAVREFLKAADMQDARHIGVNSYKAYYNIGVIYECLGHTEEARSYYNKAGNYGKALRRLDYLDSL